MNGSDGIDVIVRFHDMNKLRKLDRAVFSLVMQSYRPLHIHLTTQRFAPTETAAVQAALEPILSMDSAPSLSVHNWSNMEPADARSALANLGFAAASQRYLAFLDYDDVVYPEAYELLISQLQASGDAIAFGRICVKETEVFSRFDHSRGKQFPFKGESVVDLFKENFCPIHSFVLDRTRLPVQLCFFEPLMTKNEDYDFLLRICAQCPANFSLINTIVGDYRLNSDGSNTILTESATTSEGILGWLDAEAFIEARRRTTPVSKAVQHSLGIRDPVANISIRALLDRGVDSLRRRCVTPGPVGGLAGR